MIYILCPANKATGGPELLHQLGYKLNMLGFPAKMLYLNVIDGTDPVCESYHKYQVPWCTKIEENEDTIVIVPEINIPLLHQLANFRCFIWWLSVDNAVYSKEDLANMQHHTNLIHLAQSHYAINFLTNTLHIDSDKICYLSDYLNGEFFLQSESGSDSERDDVILFNPKKGFSKTAELIAKSDYQIKWQALSGLTPYGMRETMKKAKIYVDFGSHPGKDRIPREAAMCGCLVATNTTGSAAYSEDVPISSEYKFSETDSASYILSKLCRMLEEYPTRKNDYTNYLTFIKQEYMLFETDVLRIFRKATGYHPLPDFDAKTYTNLMLSSIQEEDYRCAYNALVHYRLHSYPESANLDTIETIIRMGIGEYAEAKISVERGLEKDPQNYELNLYAAQLHLHIGNPQLVRQYCACALQHCLGSADEEFIKNTCAEFMSLCDKCDN